MEVSSPKQVRPCRPLPMGKGYGSRWSGSRADTAERTLTTPPSVPMLMLPVLIILLTSADPDYSASDFPYLTGCGAGVKHKSESFFNYPINR